MPFLIDQKNWRAPRPPSHANHFPKVTRSKFWDSHFIQHSWKTLQLCLLGWPTPPLSPCGGGGLQATNTDQCLHIVMVIGKCTDVFWGVFIWLGAGIEKRGICRGNFSWMNLSWGKKISMKGAQDFLALFQKKQWKNKYDKVFQLKGTEYSCYYFPVNINSCKYSRIISVKRNRNYYAYEGLSSS